MHSAGSGYSALTRCQRGNEPLGPVRVGELIADLSDYQKTHRISTQTGKVRVELTSLLLLNDWLKLQSQFNWAGYSPP